MTEGLQRLSLHLTTLPPLAPAPAVPADCCRHGGAGAGGDGGPAAPRLLPDQRHKRAALPVRPYRAPPTHSREHLHAHIGILHPYLRYHCGGQPGAGEWVHGWLTEVAGVGVASGGYSNLNCGTTVAASLAQAGALGVGGAGGAR